MAKQKTNDLKTKEKKRLNGAVDDHLYARLIIIDEKIDHLYAILIKIDEKIENFFSFKSQSSVMSSPDGSIMSPISTLNLTSPETESIHQAKKRKLNKKPNKKGTRLF